MSDSLWPHELQHTRLPCPSLSPRVCLNSCPLSRWCHPTISSAVIPFSSCPQSFPASGSFPMSWLFAFGGQSIGASALASVLPMNIQGWFPLGLASLISLLSKGLSRVFSSTTVLYSMDLISLNGHLGWQLHYENSNELFLASIHWTLLIWAHIDFSVPYLWATSNPCPTQEWPGRF